MPNARVTYPVVVVEVEGMKCRELLDTGAGSSYASAALLNRISTRKRTKEVRKIEMLKGTSTREVELVTIETGDVNRKFAMPAGRSHVRWPTTVTSKPNAHSKLQIAHIKFKSITANSNRSQRITNHSQQITNRSQQIQIAHSKFKSFTAN